MDWNRNRLDLTKKKKTAAVCSQPASAPGSNLTGALPRRLWSWSTTRSPSSTPRPWAHWPSCSVSTFLRTCSRTCPPTCPRACRSCASTRMLSPRSRSPPSRGCPMSSSWVWKQKNTDVYFKQFEVVWQRMQHISQHVDHIFRGTSVILP